MFALRKSLLGLLSVLAVVVMASAVKADTINFDDGVVGTSVGAFYAARGVIFTNATFDGFSESPGSVPNGVRSTLNGYHPTPENPIIATFSTGQSLVSLTGLDVGGNGFTLRAYDAAIGGNLLDSATAFGSGLGTHTSFTLTVTGTNIMRVEFFHPEFEIADDGLIFDDLVFTSRQPEPVPEPATIMLLGSGLIGAMGAVRRRRQK